MPLQKTLVTIEQIRCLKKTLKKVKKIGKFWVKNALELYN